MVSRVVPSARCLGVPLALEAPKVLDLERLLALCSIGSLSGATGSFKGLMVPKGAPMDIRGLRML